MSTSVLLLLVGIACGVGFAVLAVYGQVRLGRRLSQVRWGAPVGILAVGVVIGVGAWLLDSSTAKTTLFEVEAPGSLGVAVGAPAPVREFDLRIEHPGVEHSLWLAPTLETDVGEPDFAVELHVRLDDPAGQPVVDQDLVLDPECRDTSGCGWASWSTPFTPATAQTYRLAVTVLTTDVPLVHVLVTDPEKTDGERAPGY